MVERAVLCAVILLSCPLHAFADCSGGGKPVGADCGSIGFEGCCDGDTLYFCEGGKLCYLSCKSMPQCGFHPEKLYYDCNASMSEDPSGKLTASCQREEPCQGLSFAGCCLEDKVYWCQGGKPAMMDCASNSGKSTCGWNEGLKVSDCMLPGSPSAPACFLVGDVVTIDDSRNVQDAVVDLEGIAVPDLPAPGKCKDLAAVYDLLESDCPVLSGRFFVKQVGCVAVLVKMIEGSTVHPAAKVTVSGVQFEFMDGGKERLCTGQFKEERLDGQCQWDDQSCTFSYLPVQEPAVVAEPEGQPKPGGCSQAGRALAGVSTSTDCQGPVPIEVGSFLFLFAFLSVLRGVGRGILRCKP